jgi:hypothetical protein
MAVFDEDGNRLYGYCAFSSSRNLRRFGFALAPGQALPRQVYITLRDRRAGRLYTSNLADTSAAAAPEPR